MVIKSSTDRPKPTVLVIMDGVGAAQDSAGNAVTKANTPILNKLWSAFPHGYLEASGTAVGLPDQVRGNSEVGHTNIGAGKVVFQDLPRINRSIENGVFFSNTSISQAVERAVKNGKKIHIMGCISDGQVHSHIDHFFAIIDFLKQHNVKENVFLHAFTDGRDSAPTSGIGFLRQALDKMSQTGVGKLASIIGRYYAMDRNDKWERTQMAYDLLTEAKGKKTKDYAQALQESYNEAETDEFVQPKVMVGEGDFPVAVVDDGDSVIFLNYRPDRAIQISQAFLLPEFDKFKRGKVLKDIFFVGMTEYSPDLPMLTAFPDEELAMPIGKLISESGLRQLRIAESEKFPHVTYFFNGGSDMVFPGEDRIEIQSPNVPTYDQMPEMSAHQITTVLLEKIELGIYDFILVNYANGDMVGHTGVIDASIKAVETVDYCLRRLVPAVLRRGGEIVITADHGNVEELINLETGEVDTQHSLFPVPLVHVSSNPTSRQLPYGILGDIAPTLLNIMRLDTPSTMTGMNLLKG